MTQAVAKVKLHSIYCNCFPRQLSARYLGQCAISFAPEQWLSAIIDNENLNVFNYDNTVCQIRTLHVNPSCELSRFNKHQIT